MATDFIMPRLPDQQQAAFYQPQMPTYSPTYSQPQAQPPLPVYPPQPPQQQCNPQISPLSTSNNASPTSPRSYHGRQMRPLYMPAVLRPTEFPSKAPTQKPKPKPSAEEDEDDKALRSSGSFISLSGLSALGRLSRRSTGDSGKCVDGNWNLDMFPVPKGSPTMEHWKPDSQSPICDEATCKRRFGTWVRRHHCRKCGNIFCDSHSAFQVPLDQDVRFNPRASPVRACGHCYGEFKEWRSRTNSQASSAASSELNSGATPTTPIMATSPTATKIPSRASDAAQSVPRDWNWSTF